jgi:hypothetical protein
MMCHSPALSLASRRSESQALKCPQADRTHAAALVDAPFRWCLSGTPCPNELSDLAGQLYALRAFPYAKPPGQATSYCYSEPFGGARFRQRLLPGCNLEWTKVRTASPAALLIPSALLIPAALLIVRCRSPLAVPLSLTRCGLPLPLLQVLWQTSGQLSAAKVSALQEQPLLHFLARHAFRSTKQSEGLTLPPLAVVNELLQPTEADAAQYAEVVACTKEQFERLKRANALSSNVARLTAMLLRLRVACDHPKLAVDALRRMR